MDRRIFLTSTLALGIAPPAFAQSGGSATSLRELLTVATQLATERLGQTDGFFGDAIVRIPLPGLLGATQRRLQPVGLAGPLDDVELRLNRAAEGVMPVARELFTDAIRGLTVQDALGIVRGGDTGATDYLRTRTEMPLTGALKPPMEETLSSSGAYRAVDQAASLVSAGSGLGGLFGRRGAGASAADLKTELTDFAVSKALDGVFHYVGVEEGAIRSDPLRRSTSVLQRLFGG